MRQSSYRELLAFAPFLELFHGDSGVARHIADLKRRCLDPQTPLDEVERLRCEHFGMLRVLAITTALATQDEEVASEASDQPRQSLAATRLPRHL